MTQVTVFPSASSIVNWAGAAQMHRLDGDIIYVCHDNQWHYFGWYPEKREYRLLMTSSKDLGEQE